MKNQCSIFVSRNVISSRPYMTGETKKKAADLAECCVESRCIADFDGFCYVIQSKMDRPKIFLLLIEIVRNKVYIVVRLNTQMILESISINDHVRDFIHCK